MKAQNWKTIPVELNNISPEELEYFGGIEELTDYNITSKLPTAQKLKRKIEIKKKKVKSKKVKREANVEAQNESKDIDMSAWNNFLLHASMIEGLKDVGFQKPTKIQTETIPVALKRNQDILGAAETGSGKTLAFGIPIINKLISFKENCEDNQMDANDKCLYCLILTPTRELAIQIKKHLQAVCKYTDNIMISVVVGGMAAEKQIRLLKKCPDIVVATPGRLWELYNEGQEHVCKIPYVKYLVIDEADRMMEKGHFVELKQILSVIKGNKENKTRQTFVFSATLSLIHDLPNRFLLKNRRVKMQKKNKLNYLAKLIGMNEPTIIDITKESAVVETLTETQIMCTNVEKDSYLYYFLLMHPGRTLVFCNSKDSVRRLRSVLELLECQPLVLHASMQQRQRLKNLEKFERNSTATLLATDVAARGLDIKGIENVIHFQVPKTAEVYVHRSGRTARAEKEGLSLILIEAQEMVNYKKLCKTLKKENQLPKFPVDYNILKTVKDRVNYARSIDVLEHRMKRLMAQNRWFIESAKEMDVDIENENLLNDVGDSMEYAAKCRKIKAMKKQLKLMLLKSICNISKTGSYPTKSGKLEDSQKHVKQKAVKVVKKSKLRR